MINGSMVRIIKDETLDDDHYHKNTYDSDMNDVKVESCIENDQESPEIDIMISNVVCSFSVRCHLNLREIALNGCNVEYKRENGLVRMRLRKPNILATISSSGKITCTGATSELEAKQAARRCARSLQKLGFKVRFENYRIVNVLGSCTMPWAIKIESFSNHYRDRVQYEPEIQPGVVYRISDIKATVRMFSTGSITVTAPSIGAVQKSIEHVYPLALNFRRIRSSEEQSAVERKKRRLYQTDDMNDDLNHMIDDEESGDDDACDSSS